MREGFQTTKVIAIGRRMFLGSVLGAAVLAVGTVGGFSQQAHASPRILKFSDHQPADRMRTRFLREVVFPLIEAESNGRLKIEDHWDGELAQAYDALGAVSSGLVDLATTVPEYTAKELPLYQIFKSFIVGPKDDRQIAFFRRVYDEVPAFTKELADNNIVPIFFGTGYPVAFYSTEPLSDLSGIAGQKWRSASFWHLDFLKNAGATPVRVHWGPEVYEAMKSGELDGLMVNVDSGYFLKVHDVAPNILVSYDLWLGHVYPLTMNKDVWESLGTEDQDAINRATSKAYETLGDVMTRSFDAQLERLREAGAHVRMLDLSEVQSFAKATRYQDVQAAWVAEKEASGNVKAGAVMGEVTAIMKQVMATGG
ncbi:TRAP transporter substrate-binding protein DctP [Thalassospira sp. MIT1370]|uniref:TRAP transporter substrate-binding protein DctP n=1 Tax=unclassified Thalassospira TaxID=2648997 RepID=UPI00399B317A